MPIDTNATITPQNLVDYYKEFVVDVANSTIVWAADTLPFAEFDAAKLAGTLAGRTIGITGTNVGTAGNLIDASDIYDVVLAETYNYTNIRNLRAILFVDGSGGNTGSRGTAGTVFDETKKAYMNTTYLQALGAVTASPVTTDNTITASELENLLNRIKAEWDLKKTTDLSIQVNVCHASCHSSCHGSRGRR
jgi:hypothetical protein